MMTDDRTPPPKRVKLDRDELERLSKDELLARWYEREHFVEDMMSRQAGGDPNAEVNGPPDFDEKLKQQQLEASRRESVLVMRLANKESEMQDYLNQNENMKQAQLPNVVQLRSMLLDPAVNLMFNTMKREIDASKEKLEQAQNDLAAWKFTPDSQTGKRLMAKCRMLLQENEELGKVISSGRMAKLEGDIALEKKFVLEMKKSQAETDEFLVEMDEDVEGMQSTIYFLQQQLKDTKEQLAEVERENDHMRALTHYTGGAGTGPGGGGGPQGESSNHGNSEPHNNPHSSSSMTSSLANHSRDGFAANDDKLRTSNPGNDGVSSATVAPPVTDTGSKISMDDDDVSSKHSVDNGSNLSRTNSPSMMSNLGKGASCPHDQTVVSTIKTNGDVSEAMDTSDGGPPEESCDDKTPTHDDDRSNSKQTTNHAPYRTSQSSEGASYATEGTDVSNDAWSPHPEGGATGSSSSGKHGGGDHGDRTDDHDNDNSRDRDQKIGDDELRTESLKTGALGTSETLINGLMDMQQYDSVEEDT